jgi:hypothetical protein
VVVLLILCCASEGSGGARFSRQTTESYAEHHACGQPIHLMNSCREPSTEHLTAIILTAANLSLAT